MTIEDRSGTYRKSALQLDVEVLERRVVDLERRLSEMAIEIVALTEENRVLKLRLKEE
jgi:regulator of replication initiation timing